MVSKHNLVSILWSLTVATPSLPTREVFHKATSDGYGETAVISRWVNDLAYSRSASTSIAVTVRTEPTQVRRNNILIYYIINVVILLQVSVNF